MLGLCLALGLGSTVLAQEVTVVGVGDDQGSALNDAKRNAVRQVVGTYLESRTLVEDAEVVLDEIYAKSYGFVTSVNILEEGRTDSFYRVKARVNVDTNPNSELLGKLKTVIALGDPRIAVVIAYHDGDTESTTGQHLKLCEGAINEKLLAQGFSHVVGSQTMQGEQVDAAVVVDYLVSGKLFLHSAELLLPKYSDYTNEDAGAPSVQTGLVKASAEMDAQIIKADTKEVIGDFHVTSEGMKDSKANAESQAVINLAPKAAEAVRKVFARQGANVNGNVQVIVRTSQSGLTKLEATIGSLSGVHGVIMRGYENGKGTFNVDTDMKPSQIFRRLQDAGLKLFMEKASANVLEISFGGE